MLTTVLLHPAPASPFLALGTNQIQALRILSELFSATIPSEPPTPFAAHANNSSEDTTPYLCTISEADTTVSTTHSKAIAYKGY